MSLALDIAGDDPRVRAALAEALHVDGRCERAAQEWEALARAGFQPAEVALKAAMSFLAAGDQAAGAEWIRRAVAAGAPPADVLYVLAQHASNGGDLRTAERAAERAAGASGSGRALTALAVMRWRAGRREEACRGFEEALARDPDHAPAAINLVSARLQRGEHDAADARRLAEAVRAEPHRPEPFVLYHRLLRRERGRTDESREALAKARLRRWPAQEGPRAPASEPEVDGEASVSVRREAGGLRVVARFELAGGAGPRPEAFALNAGYRQVEVGGAAAQPLAGRAGAGDPANVRWFEIPPDAWRRGSGGERVEIVATGSPLPPCARLEPDWLELGEQAAWLPRPAPERRWRWVVEPELSRMRWLVSDDRPSAAGPGLVALEEPASAAACQPSPVEAIGRVGRPLLERAATLAAWARALWEAEVGPLGTASAPVVVLDRPESLLCYDRPGFTRISSGIFLRDGQDALVYHEMGHRLWGAQAGFPDADRWLCEALAEYTLHLAERAGHLPGYRAATQAALQELGGGRMPATGLAELSRAPGPEAAYVLRAKGAWAISMLRDLIGDEAFHATLRAALEHGSRRPLDTYTFFALASYFHGASVSWFANQWVHSDAAMAISVEGAEATPAADGFYLALDVRCAGLAAPGAPVELVVATETGERHPVLAGLDLGRAEVHVRTPAAPTSVTVDPHLRCYADVAQRTKEVRR